MSQFQNALPIDSVARNRAGAIPQSGVTQSLNAPGETPTPPVFEGQSVGQQLMQAMGLAGQVVSQVGQFVDQRNQFVKGQAARQADDDLPELVAKIRSGEIAAPTSADDISEFAAALAGQAVGDDASDVYRNEYLSRMSPALSEAFATRHLADQKENDDVLTAAALDSVAGKTDVNELEQASLALQNNRYFKMSEDEARSAVGLHAAKVAVESGDAEAFEAASQFMGDRERLAMTQYRNRLEQRARQNQNEAVRASESAVEERLASLYNEMENEGAPIPAEKARQIILDGGTSPQHQRQQFDQLKTRIKSQFNAEIQAIVDRQVSDTHNALIANLATIMDDPAREGSVLRAVGGEDTFTFTDAAGKDHKWTLDELTEEVAALRLRQIEQTVPAEQVFDAQAEFLTNADTSNPVWVADLDAGYTSAANGWARILEDGTAAGIPPRLSNAFQLYKRLGATSPRLRDMHMKSDGVRALFELAELGERYGYDEGQALVMATRALSPRGAYQSPEQYRVSQRAVADAVADAGATESGHLWWAQEARNSTDVMASVQQRAQFYVASLGLNPDAAVKEASEWAAAHRTIVNGWSYDFGDRRLPANVEDIMGRITEEYAASHEDEGVEAGDLSLIPSRDTPNTWILFNNATNAPVEDWSTKGTFTSIGLERVASALLNRERNDERQPALEQTIQAEEARQRQSEGRYTIAELIVEGGKKVPEQLADKMFTAMREGLGIDTPGTLQGQVEQTRQDIGRFRRDFNQWWDDFKLGASSVAEDAATIRDNIVPFMTGPDRRLREFLNNTEVDLSQ